MTARGNFVILIKRVGEICPKRVCDEAGDCSEQEVTSVEYVRYRLPWRYTIGRLRFSKARRRDAYIVCGGKETGQGGGSGGLRSGQAGRFVFRPESDTHGMVERKFHPYDIQMTVPNAVNYRTNLEESTTWQPQRNRSASVSRPTTIS